MKSVQVFAILLVLYLMTSCDKKAEPVEKGVHGTWILIQNTFFNGQVAVTQDIASSPPRTITFRSNGELSTIAIDDSVLYQAHYFKTGYNSLVGPVLDLYKADKQPWVSLIYIVDQDILMIDPFIGRKFSYKFRRL
jgi:hypothetical protein